MKSLIAWFAEQELLGWLISALVLVFGIFCFMIIQRETFPNVSYDIVAVTTLFPGASPSEVEKLITNPLEQNLKEVTGIKQMTSVSTEGRSLITLVLDPDQVTMDKAKADIEAAVDSFTDRPSEAKDSVVVAVESKLNPLIGVTLSGDIDEKQLRKAAKLLEKKLHEIPGVAKINFDGLRDVEFLVEASPEKLKHYQITLEELVEALKRQNLSIPGGVIEGQGDHQKEIGLRTSGQYDNPSDIADTVIRANDLGEIIKVSDVATVQDVLSRPNLLVRVNGQKSIVLRILKKENADAISLVDAVKAQVKELSSSDRWPQEIKIGYIDDFSFFIRRRLSVLQNNLLQGFILVLIIVGLLMPWRTALLTSIGIPFAFLATIIVFYYFGISLNLISVMGLIIVCGMLVDDAIVVSENTTQMLERGSPIGRAAIIGVQEIWMPVAASVLTTVGAFLPMLAVSGIFGKFIKYIPMGVIVALFFSLFECYFILPAHLKWMYKGQMDSPYIASGKNERIYGFFHNLWQKQIVPKYVAFLDLCLRYRYLVLIIFFLLVLATGFLVKFKMRIELFPADGVEMVVLNFEAPVGTPLEVTQSLMQPIEKIVSELPKKELMDYVVKTGMLGVNMFDPETFRGSHYAQMILYLTPETDRQRSSREIKDELRQKIGTPNNLKFKFGNVPAGPPVGSPINIGVRGESYDEILKVVSQIKSYLESLPGALDITDNYFLGKEEINIEVDPVAATAAQLSVANVGTAVRAAYEGVVATTIRNLEEKIDVRVSLPAKNRANEKSLDTLLVHNPRGNMVPLNKVARFTKSRRVEAYFHEDNQRQVIIKGNIDDRITSSLQIHAAIKEKLPEILSNHPNVRVYFGGEAKDTNESLNSLRLAFVWAIMLIYCMLILSFKSFVQPLFILLSIPMGVISVIWAFFLHQNKPLSFLCLIGVIALSGVVVNNIIVLMDTINHLRQSGLGPIESLIESGRRRLRPIFLTTATTVFGLLPTAYGWGGKDPFVVPIALALSWGLAIGAILTIIFIPCFLAIKEDFESCVRWLKLKGN